MKKYQINILFTAAVVALLLLSSCVSGILSTAHPNTTDAPQQNKNVTQDKAIITCYAGGIPRSQMINPESATQLKELFTALVNANARDPCSAETLQLQHQILLCAEHLGLLPRGGVCG